MARPTKYKKEYCEQIIEFMREGASLLEFSVSIGVTRECLHEWSRTHSTFSDAMRLAAQGSQAWWERIVRLAATNRLKINGEPVKLDYRSTMFMMQSRFTDFRSEKKIIIEGAVSTGDKLTDEELRKRIEELERDRTS